MKVLFVYKYLTLGGVEAVLRARLDGLGREGIEAHAWFFHDLGGRSSFAGLEDRVHVGDVASCLRWAREQGFDLLGSIDTEEVLAGFTGEEGRPRLVMECHSAYLENIEYLSRLRFHRPAAVFTPSEEQRRLVRERVGEGVEVRVVPNPLRRGFVEEPPPFPAPPPRPVVAWIGRLDELKNWEGFLDVGATLARRGRDVELWIVGRPVAEDGASHLLRRARKTGVLGNLRWLSALPHARVPALLDAVRDSGGVVVSTSRGESFGLTIVEAMARRCAVAVPDRAPFTEYVEEGLSGTLFRPGSAESAAGRIERLLDDAGLRAEVGHRGREIALERFAPGPALAALARELRRLAGS